MYAKCRVVLNTLYDNKYGKLRIAAEETASVAKPGQFIMLKCWDESVPFLPRPFSINYIDRDNGTIDILYKIVGAGTKKISQLCANDDVMVLGPLGNSFIIPNGARTIAVVGRGVGAAPMLALSAEAVNMGIYVYAFLSAGREEYLFDRDKYTGMGAEVYSTYDTEGSSILVTDYLTKVLEDRDIDAVYVCGSKRLIKQVYILKERYGFPAYVSLEEHMACGIGACKGCVCTTKNADGTAKYERVCKEGPIFPIERLLI